jgi:hypothetical protein
MGPEGIVGYVCGPNFNLNVISQLIYLTEVGLI